MTFNHKLSWRIFVSKLLILPLWGFVSDASNGQELNWEGKLLDDLFVGYNRFARPIADIHSPIEVSIALYLTKILALHWKDDYIKWKPENYGGLTRIIVPPSLIWLPDFGLENSADSIYDDMADRKFRAGINQDGAVQWVPGGKFITSCQLDITYYPFDRQTCEMDFVDWTYDGRFVMLVNGSDEIELSVFRTHGEWDIVRTRSVSLKQSFDSDPGVYFPTVKFILHLKRKPRFYMINIVAPCILMSILDLLVFYLPPDSGEKVSLGITVLLSYSVFLLLIAENVPKTSECVPLIGVYLTLVMAMTALSIVVSVLVLRLHYHDSTTVLPWWLRRFVFSCLGRFLCVMTPQQIASSTRRGGGGGGSGVGGAGDGFRRSATTGTTSHNISSNFSSSVDIRLSAFNATTTDDDTTDETQRLDGNGIKCREQFNRKFASALLQSDLESLQQQLQATSNNRRDAVLQEILQHMRFLTARMMMEEQKDEIKEEWRLLAKVLDRVLLFVFAVVIAGLSAAILYVIPAILEVEDVL